MEHVVSRKRDALIYICVLTSKLTDQEGIIWIAKNLTRVQKPEIYKLSITFDQLAIFQLVELGTTFTQ